MVAVIGGPVELIMAVSFIDGILCLVPAGVDESERLAHDELLSDCCSTLVT